MEFSSVDRCGLGWAGRFVLQRPHLRRAHIVFENRLSSGDCRPSHHQQGMLHVGFVTAATGRHFARVRAPFAGLAALIAALLPAACERTAPRGETRAPGAMRVVVSIPALEGLVRPLVPPNADVRVLISPGRSEHGFEPTPQDIVTLEQADLVVLIGLGLETSIDAPLRRRPRAWRHEARLGEILGIEASGRDHGHAHDHDHDAHADHDHAVDPHVWLDPVLVRQALPAIARLARVACGESELGDAASIDAALEGLLSRVDAVDASYRAGLEPFKGRAIITHHAAFGRLAERYGLRVVEVIRPIEGAEPTPAELAAVVDAISRENVGAIFVEPQFDARDARQIAERAGVAVGTLDPLGTGDWFAMMESNLRELTTHLGP